MLGVLDAALLGAASASALARTASAAGRVASPLDASGSSSSGAMGKSYPPEIRWLVVYMRRALNHSHAQVTASLCGLVCEDTQQRWLLRYDRYNDVYDAQSKQRPGVQRRSMSIEDDMLLFYMVLDSPNAMLKEHAHAIVTATGKQIPLSVVCRAMHRLGLSRTRLQNFAYQRDEQRAQQCWNQILTYWYTPPQ